MNWWLAAGGLMASICGAGHAIAGHKMFYLPIKSAIADELQAGVLTGMWHLITIHFALSAFALFVLAARGPGDAAAWLIAAQFAAYAAVYLVTSLRLGGALNLSVGSLRLHCNSHCSGRHDRALKRRSQDRVLRPVRHRMHRVSENPLDPQSHSIGRKSQ